MLSASEKTRAMVEGALMAVIASILGLAGIYLPFLGFITSLLTPVPIIILIRKYTLKIGLLSLLVTTFLLTVLSGSPITGLLLALQFGGLAVVYGLSFKNGLFPGKSILFGTVVFLISSGISIFVAYLLTGINPLAMADMFDSIQESFEPLIQLMKDNGQFQELAKQGVTEQDFRKQLEQMALLIQVLLPAVFILTAVFSAYLNYVVARIVMMKLRITVPPMTPLREWRIPWYYIWVIILGIGAVLLGDQTGLNSLDLLGKNLILVGALLFFVVGITFSIYFYQKAPTNKILKVFMIIFMIINLPAGVWFMVVIGLADTIFNFRRFYIDDKVEEKKEGKK